MIVFQFNNQNREIIKLDQIDSSGYKRIIKNILRDIGSDMKSNLI